MFRAAHWMEDSTHILGLSDAEFGAALALIGVIFWIIGWAIGNKFRKK